MIPLTTFVQTTTYDLTPASSRLPPFIWSAFTTLNKVHSIWRWFRRAEVYTNPNNLAHLLTGHVLNFIVGDIVILRIAAQCLLISTRILECVQEQAIFYQEAIALKTALLGRYPLPVRSDWKCHSIISSYKIHSHDLWNHVQRTAASVLSLFEHAFKLSMRILDTIDAFSLSPYTRNEAFNESFVNAIKWIDTIVENKEELLSGLTDNRIVIERILQGSPFTYEQLRDAVTKTVEKTEAFHIKTKKITTFSNGIIIATGKRMIDEVMISLGLARLRPTWLAI